MNIAFLYPIIVFIAGALTAYQPLVNAKLGQHLDSPIWASFISFASGTVILLFVGLLINNGKFMSIETQGLKWWMFIGGALGAVFVTVALYVVPFIGVGALVALLIAGQLALSVLLDHFGILAAESNPITWQRFAGITLLITGAVVILKTK